MRALIESTEDNIPEDIRKLNETIRAERRRPIAIDRKPSLDRYPFLDGGSQTREQQFLSYMPSVSALGGSESGDDAIEPSYPLERWLIQAHAYREEQAAKVSLLGRLFSGEAQRVKAGVVHEAKRFSIEKTETSRDVEIGVAVRLSVATSIFNGKFELTLPNLAADAQLHGVEARIGITVLGFTGPLGDILPSPRKLDVETCGEYMNSFRKIQAFIFGKGGWNYVMPTALSYEE